MKCQKRKSMSASTSAKGVEWQDFAIQALGKQVSNILYFVHLGFYNLQHVLGLRAHHRLSLSTPLMSSEVSEEAARQMGTKFCFFLAT